jgi:uncharacterized protein (DUF2141 family)
MPNRALLPTLLALFVAIPLYASDTPAADPARGVLGVRIQGLRSTRGRIGCALFASPKGFPSDSSEALQQRWCPVQSASPCAWNSVPAGTYALSCFHDENQNGRLDTGMFGIPVEGYGFSNEAKASLFGPPSFAEAKFWFAGKEAELSLKVVY